MPGRDPTYTGVGSGDGGFPPTHWSAVLAAGRPGSPAGEAALTELCERYWFPLYAFARREGHPPEEAKDLTQGFFARLLDKQLLCGVKREGGKFRSYLLQTFKFFLINEWRREHARKRGGGKAVISIDDTAETRYERELVDQATPETLFERQWALTVLDRVLARLRDEYGAAGKRELFARLQGSLPGVESRRCDAETRAALEMSEPAVRMAVHRLRHRYGELLRAEVAATVASPADIDGEIRHLIAAIGK